MGFRCVLVIGMLAALAAVAASPALPDDTGGLLAFESNNLVYVANPDGSGVHAITGSAGYAPSWSPDGSKLVVDTGVALETIDPDGTNPSVLVTGSGLVDPAWSPDGTKIAYADTNSGNSGIWVVSATGGSPVRLTSAGVESSPTWSPDGAKIAYLESDITANPPSIWTMNADGTSQTKLTTTDPPDPGTFDLRNLAWSPDATMLAYSTGAEPEVYGQGARPASIAVVGVDGSDERILVAAPLDVTYTDPSWSPDGSEIIFSATPLGGSTGVVAGLDRVNAADGSGQTQVFTGPGDYPIDTADWTATVPGAPGAVSAAAVDSTRPGVSGQVQVSFTVPVSNGGTPVTSYRVTASPGGIVASGSSSPITVSGLTDGTTYTFTVAAVNAAGQGALSAASNPVTPASVPDAPTAVSAVAGDGQVTVGFSPPASNAGAPVTSYTVVASPGGTTATAAASPITLTGLSNGTTYTLSIVATNRVGPGAAATVTAKPAATGGTGVSGGGGGGGGGSSALGLTVAPSAQTIASGATATWTILVTNTGGAYLYAVGVADDAAPACGIPASFADTASLMAPGVTIGYTCSSPGETASFANTVVATATTGPGPTISSIASAQVTVAGVTTSSAPTPAPTSPRVVSATHAVAASLVVSKLKPVRLGAAKPRLGLVVRLSKATKLVVTLRDGRGRTLARWSLGEQGGRHTLALLLPRKARHPGHDELELLVTGGKPKTMRLSVVA